MSRIHEGKKITLHLTIEQYEQVNNIASEKGLTPQNYLRSILGFPVEQRGQRKDLHDRDAAISHMAKGAVAGCPECIEDLKDRNYRDTMVCSHQH